MPTFGQTTEPAAFSATTVARKRATQQVAPENGTLVTLHAYLGCSVNSRTVDVKGLIYADNGSDFPGDLLATSGTENISIGTTPDWYVFTFTGAEAIDFTASTKYWLCYHHDGPPSPNGSLRTYRDLDDGGLSIDVTEAFASTADPWSGGSTHDGTNGIYVTYDVAGERAIAPFMWIERRQRPRRRGRTVGV